MWKHLHDIRSVTLFVGPSGCGKTEVWRSLKRYVPYIMILDASSITNDGWRGNNKYYSGLQQVHDQTRFPQTDKWILVYDEFDKMITPKYNAGNENTSYSVQSEFLKMVEGSEISLGIKDGILQKVDTTLYSFVFLGSFEQIYRSKSVSSDYGFSSQNKDTRDADIVITMNDIRTFGLRPEFSGRIEQLVQMHPLTSEDLFELAVNRQFGPGAVLGKLYHIDVLISDSTAKALVNEAIAEGTGARQIFSGASAMMDEVVFDGKIDDLVIL